jgi:hypothetical protein
LNAQGCLLTGGSTGEKGRSVEGGGGEEKSHLKGVEDREVYYFIFRVFGFTDLRNLLVY